MQKDIKNYLCGPRNYYEGVTLYQRYGSNLRLKREFAADDNSTNRQILLEELRKLAGISESQMAALPRLARKAKAQIPTPEPQAPESAYDTAPEPVKKMIRFRERFPFLNSPDCPDVLKVLVADMFTALANYKAAHARLQTLGDDPDASKAVVDCEEVVNEYLRNREIWEELEYYQETGEILGKAAKFREMEEAVDLASLSDVDLMKKLASARTNVSKHKRAAEDPKADTEKATTQLQAWTAKKNAFEAEVERRKKKPAQK